MPSPAPRSRLHVCEASGCPRWRGRRLAAELAGAVLGGIGAVLLLTGLRGPDVSAHSASASATAIAISSVPAVPGEKSAVPADHSTPVPPPVHLDIPRIGVDTALIPLGLNEDGTVMVPPVDPRAPAGWYRHLAAPGEPGPAVLLGHVDSYRGPAVFSRLAELRPGDGLSVRRADGSVVAFVVESVRTHPKSEFPTEAVYGQTDSSVLRLITCGGAFDRAQRTYLSNVIVYAVLAAESSEPDQRTHTG
jgi:sortase (surface protein transpeptidase)